MSIGPTEPLILHGALGSPYSMKMRALLRYRRLPFLWRQGAGAMQLAAQKMKAPVIPVLEYPDGRLANDSTPLIHELELLFANGREVVPPDPAQAFLACLIEDFADEWLTKAMFAFRWLEPSDQERMSTWLAFDAFGGGERERIEAFAAMFRERQVGRMSLVGCTHENWPVIAESTGRFLAAFDTHVQDAFFLFGTRPSLAEFAIYGQLSQYGVDPSGLALMRAHYPWAYRWLYHCDDLSGLEGEWRAPDAEAPAVLREVLTLIGDVYFPFLLANARALEAGAESVQVELLGKPFIQGPFRYQAKCLADLRRRYAELPQTAKAKLNPLLAETGCLNSLEIAP